LRADEEQIRQAGPVAGGGCVLGVMRADVAEGRHGAGDRGQGCGGEQQVQAVAERGLGLDQAAAEVPGC
jgi:hypothetical protein